MTILYVVQSAEAQEEAAKQPSGYVEMRNQTTTIHLPDEGDADLLSSAMHPLYKYTCLSRRQPNNLPLIALRVGWPGVAVEGNEG